MNKFLSFKEAADYLGIAESELQKIVDRGRIPSYKIGGVYTRFRADELNSYRRKSSKRAGQKGPNTAIDRIKDFFYFNDFYIYSSIAIIVVLYFIFK